MEGGRVGVANDLAVILGDEPQMARRDPLRHLVGRRRLLLEGDDRVRDDRRVDRGHGGGVAGVAPRGPSSPQAAEHALAELTAERTLSARSVRTSTKPGSAAAARTSSGVVAVRCCMPASAATCAKSTPLGVITCSSNVAPAPCSASGRKSKMLPPPLFAHTIVSSAPAREAASRPPMSCSTASSPVSSQARPARGERCARGRRHHAVDPVRAAVREEADRVGEAGEEALDVADRHRRADPHGRCIGQRRRERGPDLRLERVRHVRQRGRDELVGRAPLLEPARVAAAPRSSRPARHT